MDELAEGGEKTYTGLETSRRTKISNRIYAVCFLRRLSYELKAGSKQTCRIGGDRIEDSSCRAGKRQSCKKGWGPARKDADSGGGRKYGEDKNRVGKRGCRIAALRFPQTGDLSPSSSGQALRAAVLPPNREDSKERLGGLGVVHWRKGVRGY